jgi:hypothetical protein
MKKAVGLSIAGVVLAWSLVFGETITASSDPFTFPPFSGVKNGITGPHQIYFKCSGLSLKSNAVSFAWSVPMKLKDEIGTISVYSLQGRTIKKIHVNSNNGSILWKMTQSESKAAGMCIAYFSFGSVKQNAKLVINK